MVKTTYNLYTITPDPNTSLWASFVTAKMTQFDTKLSDVLGTRRQHTETCLSSDLSFSKWGTLTKYNWTLGFPL